MAQSRLSAVLIGLGVLAVHTAGALGGVLVLAWVAANPPGLVPAVLAFVVPTSARFQPTKTRLRAPATRLCPTRTGAASPPPNGSPAPLSAVT